MGKGKRKGKGKPQTTAPASAVSGESPLWEVYLGEGPVLRKRLSNALIVFVLVFFSIDGFPAVLPGHKRLKDAIDAVLDVTGLWQEAWTLFAPSPIKHRWYIEARITYYDQSVHVWRTPAWGELSVPERTRLFRQAEYFDSIREQERWGAWDAFGAWIAETIGREAKGGELPAQVELYRGWSHVQPPAEDQGWLDPVELRFHREGKWRFHVWRRGAGR